MLYVSMCNKCPITREKKNKDHIKKLHIFHLKKKTELQTISFYVRPWDSTCAAVWGLFSSIGTWPRTGQEINLPCVVCFLSTFF